MEHAIPWYRSSIIVGVMVSLVCKALVVSGLTGDIAGAQQQQLTNILVSLVGGAGDLFALVKRVKQEAAPAIALTKSSAQVKHDTIAAVAAAIPVAVAAPGELLEAVASAAEPMLPGIVGQAEALAEEVPSWMR